MGTLIDAAVVAAYFMLMLGVGWTSRQQSRESYWVAERRYSASRVTASLVATIFGASSTMGVIGLAYARGLTAVWWSLVGGLALIPFAVWLAPRVRRLKVFTLPDILAEAYGKGVAVPAGIMIAAAWCGIVAAQMVAGARLVSGLFPLGFQTALLLVSGLFIAYTLWGGQKSVVRTDAWQLLLFVAGVLASLVLLWNRVTAGASALAQVPPGHWAFPVSKDFGWYEVLVFYPLIVGLPYLVGPDIYSRVLCARNETAARRAALWAGAAVIPLCFLLALFGILARASFPGVPPETAVPRTLESVLGPGLRGLAAVGFLGAVMSSADTCLLSAGTILTLNVVSALRPLKHSLHVPFTRGAVLVLGVLSWFIAGREQGIIASLLLGYTVFVGGVVFPTLGALFRDRWRFRPACAGASVLVGGMTAILGKLNGGAAIKALLGEGGQAVLEGVLGPRYLSILPLVLSAGILVLGSSPLIRRGRKG